MDPSRFDGLVQRLSGSLTRRSVLGASVLTALGLGDQALAKKKRHTKDTATAEACIPTGKRCPAPKPRGRTGKKRKPKTLSCKQCCQRRTTINANGKRVCYCAPTGDPCTETRECCDGTCTGGICQLTAAAQPPPPPPPPPPPVTPCLGSGAACTSSPQCCAGLFCGDGTCRPTGSCTTQGTICTGAAPACCTGICNAGGSTTGPLADTADECVLSCRSGRATCDPNLNGDEQCCSERSCVDNPATGTGEVCNSFTGEQCIADPAATATAPSQGTCESPSNICPGAGNVGPTGVCCRASGEPTPAGLCPNASGCCTGECEGDLCCAPDGQNPTESGGPVCAGGESAGCCSGLCSGTTADDSLCIGGV